MKSVIAEPTTILLHDDFALDVETGGVVGGDHAGRRIGLDVEGRIGVDHGAARLGPLMQPGWGRECLSYGPFAIRPGLVLLVSALNGHNSSQTYYQPESPRDRRRRRVRELVGASPRRSYWHENFAVGLFADPAPSSPLDSGASFVMHAATETNGELWASAGGGAGRALTVRRAVPNVPAVYALAVREHEIAFYESHGLQAPDSPTRLVPLSILEYARPSEAFAVVAQCIQGEVDYLVDTRVYSVTVAEVERWSAWYGSASVADALDGGLPAHGEVAAGGVRWSRTGELATLAVPGTALVRAVIDPNDPSACGLALSTDVEEWRATCGSGSIRLVHIGADGHERALSEIAGVRASTLEIAVLDGEIELRADGRSLLTTMVATSAAEIRRVGVIGDVEARGLRHFEAHPPSIELSRGVPVSRPTVPVASTMAAEVTRCAVDHPPVSERWQRSIGAGRLVRVADGWRVDATRANPNPGRTAFTVPWTTPSYADIEVEMTPPGSHRGQGERGRGGLILYEDDENYVIVNVWLDDVFGGTSVSSFYRLGGHEDMYDAVWTNVARRISWGKRSRLRVVTDGASILALVDADPVLYRALTDVDRTARRLEVRRVGIAVNWEWGDDTGTVFHSFQSRTCGS